jgi:type II secretory pathway pseudopilin PulG
MLNKAFTMIELVFIITILGILTMVMAPRLQTSHLQEAADQLIKHIRLTQSLALAEDFYLADSTQSNEYPGAVNVFTRSKAQKFWFKRWWQISVNNNQYSIFSDAPSIANDNSFDGTVTFIAPVDKVAIDIHSGEYLTPVAPPAALGTSFTNIDLMAAYDVSITMPQCSAVGGTIGTLTTVLFDHLGRPHCNKPANDASLNPFDRLMNTQMRIVLTETGSGETINICIEEESGYIHLCE